MRPKLGRELEEFRAEVSAWIAGARVPALAELDQPEHRRLRHDLVWGLWLGARNRFADAWDEWMHCNLEAGYVCPQWPVEHGGRGWTALQVMIWNEELAAALMPRATRGLAEYIVGPALIVHGTEAQKRHFLPRIISGEDVYIQGFSEPNAGSDLASLTTVGRVEGDEIVISGQKIWTSIGHTGNMMFTLCRTDPAVRRHRGITYVLLPITNNRIEMRDTRQMTGESEFTEEFLDGARAPLFNVIGGLNNGWRVAMATLANERGSQATTQHVVPSQRVNDLIAATRERGLTGDRALRQKLAWAYTQAQLMRHTGLRIVATMAQGREEDRVTVMNKLFASEYEQRLAELGMEIQGAAGLVRPEGDGYPLTQWQYHYLFTRAATIQAGSSQIQRNIIGERVLGLPREPRASDG
jgi:alkylation response protein AidB-like acyl-CoA dehydrogenase